MSITLKAICNRKQNLYLRSSDKYISCELLYSFSIVHLNNRNHDPYSHLILCEWEGGKPDHTFLIPIDASVADS